ncbi:MAG: MarR family EPS-associated transcriptional regulator [Campylobacterota bacterium]|nr:MarR family EPS-associated transcriptional regulator [Campylobacterota bacterium]
MHPDELTLSILRKSESIESQPSLAKELGYSVGKINFILKALVDKGLIKIENFSNSKSKKNYRYLLTEDGIKEKIKLTEKFVARKKKEYDELHKELQEYKKDQAC